MSRGFVTVLREGLGRQHAAIASPERIGDRRRTPRDRFVDDSALEGDGFEPSVPRDTPSSIPTTSRTAPCRYFRRSDRHSGSSHLPYRNGELMVRIHLPPPVSLLRT